MTFRQAVSNFISVNKPFNDYWQMQYAWTVYVDSLEKDCIITMKQQANWGNPCTPDGFKNFNLKFKRGE